MSVLYRGTGYAGLPRIFHRAVLNDDYLADRVRHAAARFGYPDVGLRLVLADDSTPQQVLVRKAEAALRELLS